jgi:hypothetical protein
MNARVDPGRGYYTVSGKAVVQPTTQHGGPRSAAPAQQQLAQPMPNRCRSSRASSRAPGAALPRRRRGRLHRRQQPARPSSTSLRACDDSFSTRSPGSVESGNRRDYLAAHPFGRHLPLQRVPTPARFIEDVHRPRGLTLGLPNQTARGLRFARELSTLPAWTVCQSTWQGTDPPCARNPGRT